MFKNKPITLLIAAGLMIVLVFVAGILPLIGGSRGFSMKPSGDFNPNDMSSFSGATPPDGQTMPEGAVPPDGANRPQGGTPPQGRSWNFSGFPGNTDGMFPTNNMSTKMMQLLRGIQVVGGILIGLTGISAIIGILLSKRWGQIFALAASILALIFTIPGLFQAQIGYNLAQNLIKIMIALAVMVLCLLPKSRQAASIDAA